METLDLHGIRHRDAERLVENFVLLNQLPVRIITGNSIEMKSIVQIVLLRYEMKSDVESHWNLGSLIISEG